MGVPPFSFPTGKRIPLYSLRKGHGVAPSRTTWKYLGDPSGYGGSGGEESMLRYRCPQCGAFSVRGEECPGCGAGRREGAEKKPEQALIRESTIFYCDACQVPVWDSVCPRCGGEARAVTSDLRPVFPEERLLMEILLGKPLERRSQCAPGRARTPGRCGKSWSGTGSRIPRRRIS